MLSAARTLALAAEPSDLDAGGSLDARDLDRGVVLLLGGLKVGDELSDRSREADGIGDLNARRAMMAAVMTAAAEVTATSRATRRLSMVTSGWAHSAGRRA